MQPNLAFQDTRSLQLKQYEAGPLARYDNGPATPSEWFSKLFPEQARIYGCPFIELKEETAQGLTTITPLAPNIDFLAAILGGDKKLAHKVVYMEPEMQFYFYGCRDRIFKSVSEEKLGNLMRAYLIRCAEELGGDVHKLNLFLEFRSDKTIRSIVHRAKSSLACEPDYFEADSNVREKGPELYERVARAFVEQVLERVPGETLLLTDAYVHFCQYLRSRGMEPVKRKVFKDLVLPVVKEEYDLGVRNDIRGQGEGWHSGWKGIRAGNVDAAVKN
jgi:hypothetical protein